jgi:hypothetical protein
MSGSSPPKKRARSEEVEDGKNVKDFRMEEVYVAVHFEADSYTENPIAILGAFESLFEAERKIVEDKLYTIIDSVDSFEFQEKYANEFPFPNNSDSDSDSDSRVSPWLELFDREALERDLDELIKRYLVPGDKIFGTHTWEIQRTKVVYADSVFVAGFVKSAHKA